MSQPLELSRPQVAYPADGSVVPVERAVWQPFEIEPVPAGVSPRLSGKRIVIAGGSDDTAGRLSATLSGYGAKVFRFAAVSTGEARAAAAFKQEYGPVDGIIDLNVSEASTTNLKKAWHLALRQTVALLKSYYEEWATTTDATRIFYLPVTRLGGTMGYQRGTIEQPFGGIWAGLAKTLPREIPNCNIKILDLSPEDFGRLDQLIAAELYRWGLFEIGYQGGKRYGLNCRQQQVRQPEISLDYHDTILISGGGRGIGHAVAKALARNFKCRVIVTGRSPLPSPDSPWLHLDEAAFKQYTHSLFKSIPAGKKVGDVRKEVEQLKSHKELYDNMGRVEAEGLRVEYHPCDFTNPAQLGRLLAEIGPGLSGVIHNAGVDTPVRLPSKTLEGFVHTVDTKLTGFMNLFEALKDRRLKFFSNVGSLTGRWGGMVGQLDYASGNDGLARLGLWAARQVDFPVKTLCWPTWDRLGMIANFEATLKYMSAVDVEEGVYHWQRELLTGGSGEICFNGPVGKAMSPVYLRGFPVTSEVPQAERLYSQLFYTGEVSDFWIFNRVRATSRLEPRLAPAMYDFTRGGQPALPISLLLEYALALSEWVAPEGWPELHLEAISALQVWLPGLTLPGQSGELIKEATGCWQDGRWIVSLKFFRPGGAGAAPEKLAEMEIVCNRTRPGLMTAGAAPANPQMVDLSSSGAGLRWAGKVIKTTGWQKTAGGGLAAQVVPCVESDLWTVPYLPSLVLPVAALENIWRAALARQNPAGPGPDRLTVDRISFQEGWNRLERRLQGDSGGTNWTVADDQGRVGMSLQGLRWQ